MSETALLKKASEAELGAYEEGYAIGLAGGSPLDVPYERGAPKFALWVDGWTDGRWEKARAARKERP
ncbi:MAG: hypothetical protein ABSC22_17170 [Roseiarcus sp.]|jgi:ribosome modulation factor